MPQAGRSTFTRIRLKGGTGSYILSPVLTTTQRDALSAVEGMIIFNSTTDQLEEYDGSTWQAVGQVILDTHTADLDAHTKDLYELMRVAQYILPVPMEVTTTTSITADRLYACPFIVARDITIDQLAIDLTTGSNTDKCRMGIYEDGTDLYPGALVKDYGLADVEVADQGIVAIAADQALTKGLYWLVFVSDAAISMRHIHPNWTGLGMYHAGGAFEYKASQWYKAGVGIGALADPFVSGGSIYRARVPMVLPRLKSLD